MPIMEAPAAMSRNGTSTATNRSRQRDTDETRAERKRIQDRLAQRATRERTKNRIAYLEQRLSSLEAGDKHGEVANLTRLMDNLRSDNQRLRNALVKMRSTLDQALLTTEDPSSNNNDDENKDRLAIKACGCNVQSECACACAQTPTAVTPTTPTAFQAPTTPPFPSVHSRHDSVSTATTDVAEVMVADTVDTKAFDSGVALDVSQPSDDGVAGLTGLEDFFDFSPTSLLEALETGTAPFSGWTWSAQTPSPFDYHYHFSSSDTAIKTALDVEKWHVSNGAFITCLDAVKKRASSTATLDLHVPFKAAIWGWESVGPEVQHPVWNALRQVDQRVFGTWTSKAQRIALMYVCQTLIQYRENPSKENLDRVPVFLRPRPSQEKIQHPAVIDFLIWPGLRDRLVFEYEKYTATGAFSAAYVANFHFHWPYSDRDIFAYNPQHNRYEVSPIFLEYAYNFKNWTMKPGFFKHFPEMQHDIAATEETLDLPRATWTV